MTSTSTSSQSDPFPKVGLPTCVTHPLLQGQKALVTGASSGIGEAVALALGHAGADVVVNYVTNPDKAQAVADHVKRCGVEAFAQQADVSNETQVQAMFQKMVATFGAIDGGRSRARRTGLGSPFSVGCHR